LENWIESWLAYSEILSSPAIFRKWAAISTIGAALERKVWARTKGANLYPNLYVVLVGPPGIGKSAVLSQSERLLRSIPDLFVAPSSVTSASLVDSIHEAHRKIIRPNDNPNLLDFHYLTVIASEFGVFLPIYDMQFMNTLTKLYDGEPYEERRRTNKVNIKMAEPQISMLGGTTPSYLNSFLPEGAWDQGFTSRTIFVYHGQEVYTDIFADEADHDRLESMYVNLAHDLRIISRTFGKVDWAPETMAAIRAWDRSGRNPVPGHGKLLHYNSRRLAHTLKLSMISSVAESGALRIEIRHWQQALDWLLEAEHLMPDIFTSMGGITADSQAMEDCWHYMYKLLGREKQPIVEHRVIEFLSSRVPSHSVLRVLDIMEKSRLIRKEYNGTYTVYTPLPKA